MRDPSWPEMQSPFRWIAVVSVLLLASVSTSAAQQRPFTSAERQLCTATCQKQLGCAGQGQAMDLQAGCVAACEQALRVTDVVTFRPWWAAATCLDQTCGQPYNDCLIKGMGSATVSEQKCSAICQKRVGCASNATPASTAACLSECVARIAVGTVEERGAEEASYACSSQPCGLGVDICIAKSGGGPRADCATLCENQFRCGATASATAFAGCMQGCLPAAMDPSRRIDIAAAVTCSGVCGAANLGCTAKARGGVPLLCFDACSKQLGCGGAGSNEPVLIQCAGTCEAVMAGNDPAQKAGFLAVDRCKASACGASYNSCIMSALGMPQVVAQPTYTPAPVPQPTYVPPQPTYVPPQPAYVPPQPAYVPPQPAYVPPQPAYVPPAPTPVIVRAPVPQRDLAREKCQASCDKLERCHSGLGTGDCVDSCLSGKPELAAVTACSSKGCGPAFDNCLLSRLGIGAADQRCVPSCTKTLACQQGAAASPFEIADCARGCAKAPPELAAAKQCAKTSCDAYDACLTKAQEKVPSKDEIRCQTICDKAATCEGAADAVCFDRCLRDTGARAEFRAREKCGAQPCGSFDRCMLTAMGVPASKLPCEQACRREVTCQTGKPKADLGALNTCLRSCSHSPMELQVIAACSELPCNSTSYQMCSDYKRKALATPVPVPVKRDLAQERCTAICQKLDGCNPGDGTQTCITRCREPGNAAEFKAREGCGSTGCGQYDACLVGKMGVPRNKLPCANACAHELSCRPPGEARDLNALIACTRGCTRTNKDLEAETACETKGCGVAFERCVAEKTGRLAEIKSVQGQCEAWCAASATCVPKTGGDGCTKRCVEAGGQTAEFKARASCAKTACDQYDQCVLDSLGAKSDGRKCVQACRFDLECERGNQAHDYGRLAQCVSQCSMTDVELTARSDCQLYGCGSGFRQCVQKRMTEVGIAPPGPTAPATPPVPRPRR